MLRHYVTFYYPGLLFAETESQEIASRDAPLSIPESAYAYRFYDQESAEIGGETLIGPAKNLSPTHFLGGQIRTREEVEATEPGSIMAFNMRANNMARVVITRYGQGIAMAEGDVVEPTP